MSGEVRARCVVASGKAPLFSSTLPPTSSRLTGTDGAHSKVLTAGQPQLPLDFSHSQRAADGRWKHRCVSVQAWVIALICNVGTHLVAQTETICTAFGYCFFSFFLVFTLYLFENKTHSCCVYPLKQLKCYKLWMIMQKKKKHKQTPRF